MSDPARPGGYARGVSAPELSVVCKSCGSEVSPYVTECPYCGARLRKRAPKLQRRGESLEARTRKRRRRLRFGRRPLQARDSMRPYATIAVIGASAVVILVQRATDKPLGELGAISGPVGSEWWRYLTAPFAYQDIGYLFVVAVALVLFAPGLERRLGSVATLMLLIACGALGMVAADGVNTAAGDLLFASGGNGIAFGALGAWFAIRFSETRNAIDQDLDLIGLGAATAALLLLPAFEDEAKIIAGLGGAVVGLLAGLAAAATRPSD
jgi:membrane associated rhomboid family serine protease